MRSKRMISIAAWAAMLLAVSVALAARPGVRCSANRIMLGTGVAITVVSRDRTTGQADLDAAFERIAELEKCLSSHSADSELSRALWSHGDQPVKVSEDLFRAISAGVDWHARTGRTFDITVGPLLSLWTRCGKEDRIPTDEELAEARSQLGVQRIKLDPAAQTIRLPKRPVQVNLGGLGKGFCADEAAKTLRQRGATSALVAVAGDIYALGTRPDGAPWTVGVQDPRDPNNPNALLATLHLTDRAVSTSGNYQRYVTIRGRRYSHIVDPRTGRTADAVPSVTVVGPRTLDTDILGTALSILGVTEGLALVEKMPGIEVLFVNIDKKNRPYLVRSSGFATYEAPSASKSGSRKTTADR